MFNPYKRLLALIPNPPLQVGEVLTYADGVATIQVPGGGTAQARGTATVGDRVFFRDGLIEGPAPDLPVEVIEI
jgi:hypothetical protein